jgi:hypothetical protein
MPLSGELRQQASVLTSSTVSNPHTSHVRHRGVKRYLTDMAPIPKPSPLSMEKESLLPQTEEPMPRPPPAKRFSRFHGVALALVLGLFWLSQSWNCGHDRVHEDTAAKVPLEIHIMYVRTWTGYVYTRRLTKGPGQNVRTRATASRSWSCLQWQMYRIRSTSSCLILGSTYFGPEQCAYYSTIY